MLQLRAMKIEEHNGTRRHRAFERVCKTRLRAFGFKEAAALDPGDSVEDLDLGSLTWASGVLGRGILSGIRAARSKT